MPKSFATKDKKKASEMLLEGVSVQAVAAHFSVHVTTIYALRSELGHGHSKVGRASHIINLRLSDEEFQALTAFVADGGFKNRTAALRSLIRSATGFLEMKRSDFAELSEMRGELKSQGTNLNQISYALNRSAFKGGAKLTDADKVFLADLRKVYVSFEAHLSRVFREVRQKGRDAFHTGDRL
jgi:hypothetical protein